MDAVRNAGPIVRQIRYLSGEWQRCQLIVTSARQETPLARDDQKEIRETYSRKGF